MTEKRCPCCKLTKDIEEFARHKTEGRQAYCRPCSSAKSREWAVKNKARKLEHKASSRAADPDRARANNRRHYARHAERLREQARNQPAERRQMRAARQRIYRMENPEKIRQLNRARVAAQRGVGRVTRLDVERLIRLQRGRCAACHCQTVRHGKGFHLDHRTPLASGGTNEFTNLQLLCPRCNLTKSARDPLEFMRSKGFLL